MHLFILLDCPLLFLCRYLSLICSCSIKQVSWLVNREDRLVSLLEGVDIVSTALFTMYLSWAHQLYVSLYCLIAKLCEMRAVPFLFYLLEAM